MKKTVIAALFLTSFFYTAKAQVKMGNNSTTINTGAVLELESTNKGLLIPRVTLISETNISPFSATPTNSMLVFNKDSSGMKSGFYYWFDGKWTILSFANSTNAGGGGSTGGSTPFVPNNGNASQGVVMNSASNSATGQYSLASGFSNDATGTSSTSIGQSNKSSGQYSLASGYNNITQGTGSTALGQSDTASGATSFAAGLGNKASNTSAMALGQNNQSTGQYSFAAGNNNKSLATATISMGEGNISNMDYAISLGKSNTASNTNAFASGKGNTASGDASTAMGQGNTSFGPYSFTAGYLNKTSNKSSIALGQENNSSADYSFSAGFKNQASGISSTALGDNNISSGQYSFSAGYNNKATGTASIAMGQGAEAVHSYSFVFADGSGTGLKSTNSNQFSSTFNNGYRFLINTNGGAILTQNDFSPTNTYTTLGTSTNKWSTVYATNGTINTSDKRLKKNIENMNYGLAEVMNMRPVTYNWKSGGTENKIGFIAQEMQEIIPEIVSVGDDENKTMGINYAELVSVLTKAIQEQQAMINELKIEVSALKGVNNNSNTAKK